jgi:hypothetical protein
MHDSTGGCVLQPDSLFRMNVLLHGESGKRGLVESAQYQLLFTGVSVDVADREYAGNIGLKFFRIHVDLPLVEVQSPFGDRAEVGGSSLEPPPCG